MIKSFSHDNKTVSAEVVVGDLHCFINLSCDDELTILDLHRQLKKLLEQEKTLEQTT